MKRFKEWLDRRTELQLKLAGDMFLLILIIVAIAISAALWNLHCNKILTNAITAADAGDYDLASELLDSIKNYSPAIRTRSEIRQHAKEQERLNELEQLYQDGVELAHEENYLSAIKYFAECYKAAYRNADEWLEYCVCMRANDLIYWGRFEDITDQAPEWQS